MNSPYKFAIDVDNHHPPTHLSGEGTAHSPSDTSQTALTLEQALSSFLRALEGKNRSPATIIAYQADLRRFISWIHQNNLIAKIPRDVVKADVTEFLAALGQSGISGVSRARKLAAMREYFRFLEDHDYIGKSPASGVETPKREKNGRTFLTQSEYNQMLALAGSHPRDYAILQVFLQTGIRVSELCNLRVDDIDLESRVLRINLGKGLVSREIELEKKGIKAIQNWLNVRRQVLDDHLFLNHEGDPLTERGVRWLVVEYRKRAGITKKASCHSLRHTFATHKAQQGVSPFQLKEWLGHANLNTTQIYVHMSRQNARKVMEATSL